MPAEILTQAPPALIKQTSDHIAASKVVAEEAPRSWETLRNWWTGNGVETAWNHLQTAREDTLLFAPSSAVRAQLPSLLHRLGQVSTDPAHDTQIEAIKSTVARSGDLSADQRERCQSRPRARSIREGRP